LELDHRCNRQDYPSHQSVQGAGQEDERASIEEEVVTGKEKEEEAVASPLSDVAYVILITIVDTSVGQGFTPNRFTVKAGQLIELRIKNTDYCSRNNIDGENSHHISLIGLGVNTGILELEPGDLATITFTAQPGTIVFSCVNPACDIHDKLSGRILVID
jgi:uncharacterized cupredoxin-like copper-binding protein